MRLNHGGLKSSLPKGEFARNVLVMMSGTTLAQAIPLAISPILTRIYKPEDFGVFALYMALLMVLGSVAAGRYEFAINLPLDDKDAFYLVVLSFLIAIIFSSVLLFIVVLFNLQISILMGNPLIADWLYLLPLSVLLTGFYQALNYWMNRNSRYQKLAATKVFQGGMVATGQLGVGSSIAGPSGLIMGSALGQLTGVVYLFFCSMKELLSHFDSKLIAGVKNQAIRYKKFPILQLPATFIEACSAQLPVVLLGTFFGPGVVGLFSLSQRVIRLPIFIIGRSVGDVFRQKASNDYVKIGTSRDVFLSTLKKMFLLSTPFLVVFIYFLPGLFSLIFGEDWKVAGEYAQLLAPMFWLSFIVSPLSFMIFIAEKQELDLMIQIFLIIFSTLSLVIGHYCFSSVKYSLAGFSLVYSVKYLFELYVSYRFCENQSFVSIEE